MDQRQDLGAGGPSPRLAAQTFQVQERRQDVGIQPQPGQSFVDLIQKREALATE